MFQMLKNKLKDQRGLTLIELLAVIVILAIISAIAIPSILGLIDNSKRDAVVANAQTMINSAKLAVAGDADLRPTSGSKFVNLTFLEEEGYLEPLKDVDTGTLYSAGEASNKGTYTKPATGSFVEIKSISGTTYEYLVTLDGDKKDIGTNAAPVTESELKRSKVTVTK